MDKYVEIIKLLERIFGKSAVSKSLGTRTNVVRFPKGKQGLDPTTRHFDVEGTAQNNPDLVNTIKNSIEDRMGDITKMNDQELLTYKQNLQRFADYTNPLPLPTADVIEAGSKQRVTGEGLEKLIEEQGLVASPKTPLGSAQLNIKRAEQEMNKIIKENDLDSLLKGAGRDQLSWNRLHNEGLVRAVTRQILSEDIRAGKIKGLTLDDLGTSREPIDYFRKIYGEGALEQLDSLTPEFNRLSTEQEAAKLARSKFKFEPDETRTKGSTSYEVLEKEIKKPEPEEKADGGSIGLDYLMGMDSRPKYAGGGDVKKILDLIAKANKELKGKKSMEGVNPKTGEVTSPKQPVMTADDLKIKHKDAFNAHDQIRVDIGDKIAPDMIAESMAEMKGKDYFSLSQREQLDYYKKALAYVDDVRMTKKQNKSLYVKGDAITEENFGNTPFAPSQETLDNLKKAREMTKGMSLEEEMNMVLNQYDKSMFVKNEQGIVDVTNPENVQKMALLLKRDHPELYRRLEMQTEPNILENFDITGRKPNKDGGLNHLLGL